ncbi:hypothetical protein NQ317_015869 [Molorchus minor]|uniref:PSI domain-containing protein n=1 Tax=Molorchus minor TaxID=1323400 RepID=A0ABQ9JK51_9CUCU|nr:hypothetical protein NQ317_015869 [Molorchus minor]
MPLFKLQPYSFYTSLKEWLFGRAQQIVTGKQIIFTELFSTLRLADSFEHLRKTLPRFGHSLVSDRRGSLWMFGGYSLSHGPLNDIRLFDTRNITWMQVTVESTPDAKMPMGRYFHGADINQRWSEVEKADLWPPAVSGHSLTYYRNGTQESLIIIGGSSPHGGFLNLVWEYRLDKEQWQPINTKGNGPAGIYGHSTVYHSQSNCLYIFGGIIFERQQSTVSNNLYMLYYETKTWSELNSLGVSLHLRNNSSEGREPQPRFFHSSVTTDNYMIVLGGRTYPWNITDTFYAYSYNCHQWINLVSEAIEKVGPFPTQSYAQAMTIEPDGDAAYVIGGWGIDTQSTVLKLELPVDLCNIWPKRFNCLRIPGCGYCSYIMNEIIVSEMCHTNIDDCPLVAIGNSSKVTNQGKICTPFSMSVNNCSIVDDCTMCIKTNYCTWCQGKCISNGTICSTHFSECPYNKCVATDCVQCHQMSGCNWSYSRRECIQINQEQEENAVSVCPQLCIKYSTCTSCLEATDCRWSTQLDECISASYQSIYCAGGVCGLVLQAEDRQYCPEPCNSFTQCSSCLRHAHCGWCAKPDLSGEGICTEGSNERPMSTTCETIYFQNSNILLVFSNNNLLHLLQKKLLQAN